MKSLSTEYCPTSTNRICLIHDTSSTKANVIKREKLSLDCPKIDLISEPFVSILILLGDFKPTLASTIADLWHHLSLKAWYIPARGSWPLQEVTSNADALTDNLGRPSVNT
jgi:hypothetical protein